MLEEVRGYLPPSDEADGREVGAVGAVERGHVAEEGAVPAGHRHDPIGGSSAVARGE